MAEWRITEWNGNERGAEHTLPGNLTQQEIETALQRLVCRNLNVDEVRSASRRKGDPERSSQLDRIGTDKPLSFGQDPHYTAERRGK